MNNLLTDPANHPANGRLTDERIIRVRDELQRTLMYKNGSTQDYVIADAIKGLEELRESRKAIAVEPELKPANLVNEFYERYPVASFKSDTERAAALGYFMAGAELQCFGEFVKYEELCSDE
ncbi:hypothetical protein [Kluyvera ascorbata]|uniref:hypothetical protein n=1 Tax=Kluyvera ascorbata TaxID=51288 RepID=UPI0022E04AAF|nr:hypothetical protein [Kluyvera ascorbata]